MDFNKTHIIILVVGMIVALGIGIPIGYFSRKVTKQDNSYYESLIKDNDKSNTKLVIDEMNAENMKNHLRSVGVKVFEWSSLHFTKVFLSNRYLTSIPHMGGTPGDKLSADYVYDQWKNQKLDQVQMTDYDVYLSFPDDTKFNK